MTTTEKKDIACSVIEQHFKVTMEELKTKSRERRFAFPRHIWWWMMRTGTGASLEQLARHFNKDHATTLHGIRNIKNQIFCSHDFCKDLESICQQAADLGWTGPAHEFLKSEFAHNYEFPRNFGIPESRREPNITMSKDILSGLNESRIKYQLIEQ